MISVQLWKQHPGLLTIADVFLTEFMGHDVLFALGLGGESYDGECQGQHRPPFADDQGGPGDRNQESGVNRVADEPVRTRAHQLVLLLDDYARAPVSPNVNARPYSEGDPNRGQ